MKYLLIFAVALLTVACGQADYSDEMMAPDEDQELMEEMGEGAPEMGFEEIGLLQDLEIMVDEFCLCKEEYGGESGECTELLQAADQELSAFDSDLDKKEAAANGDEADYLAEIRQTLDALIARSEECVNMNN